MRRTRSFDDGRLARHLGVASALGALFDVVADVLSLVILLVLLGLRGIVPVWLFVAPLTSAIVFFFTSKRMAVTYDPIGKHYGGVLYIVIGIILWNPTPALGLLSWLLSVIASVVVMGNRLRIAKLTAIRAEA